MDDMRPSGRAMLESLEQRCLLSAGPAMAGLDLPTTQAATVVTVRKVAAKTPKLRGTYVGKLWVGQRATLATLVITSQTFEPVQSAQGRFSAGKLADREPFGGFVSADGTFAARMGLSRLYVKKVEGGKLQGSVRILVGKKLVSATFSVVRQLA